jgi:hypothetical protein
MAQIEAQRVALDAAYAASLSDADWYALSMDPAWQEMVAEQSELVADVIAKYGSKIPGAAGGSTSTEIPANFQFKVLGQDIARIQGYGIVTNQGQYTENIRMPGMLFMKTLRSRYRTRRSSPSTRRKRRRSPAFARSFTVATCPRSTRTSSSGRHCQPDSSSVKKSSRSVRRSP